MLSEKIAKIARAPGAVSELTPKETGELLELAEPVFEKEPNLLEIPAGGQVVFVGDTHGDFEATITVANRYLRDDTRLVFLGDYVDRGKDSRANINYLLCLKLTYPANLHLLQGNHEGYGVFRFYPADFWEATETELRPLYERVLLKIPLAISIGNLIGLHGALPDVAALCGINRIEAPDEAWKQVVWGDWQEIDGEYLGKDTACGRPQFGSGYFNRIMKQLGKDVLIRSHQPGTPQVIYDRRLLTIFTSHAYGPRRTIAVADLDEGIKTADDLRIKLI